VDRSDLEAKLREIQEVVEETGEQAKNTGVIVAVGVVVLLVLFYVMGRRKGRKGSARVEVYRLG
jgi:LPXTG-motif cell wall-anchored protein